MLTPEQVPEVARIAAIKERNNGGGTSEVIVAALSAWPGMKQEPETTDDHGAIHWPVVIILPLTENPDDNI